MQFSSKFILENCELSCEKSRNVSSVGKKEMRKVEWECFKSSLSFHRGHGKFLFTWKSARNIINCRTKIFSCFFLSLLKFLICLNMNDLIKCITNNIKLYSLSLFHDFWLIFHFFVHFLNLSSNWVKFLCSHSYFYWIFMQIDRVSSLHFFPLPRKIINKSLFLSSLFRESSFVFFFQFFHFVSSVFEKWLFFCFKRGKVL